MLWLNACIALFALVMLGGGVGGYVSNGSLWSLVAGVVSFVLLVFALVMSRSNQKAGYGLCFGVCVALTGVFVERLIRSGKPMPSVGLIGLCLVMLILLSIAHFQSRRTA
jgi:uncharacterized membrane protein (UPF0136 family)